MASGNHLVTFTAGHNEPPSTGAAAAGLRNRRPCLRFDAATDEAAVFQAIMPDRYADTTGITIHLWWGSATDQTTGDVVWTAELERVISETTDLDADSFAAATSLTADAPGTISLITHDTVAVTKGANMDSVVAGDLFRLRIKRDADNVADDMTGDAELYGVSIVET